jgi:hypothetical protein
VGRSDHAVGLAVGPFRLRSLRFRAWRGRLASDSNRILDPELLMSARRRRGKLRLGQCGDTDGIPTKVIRAAKAAIEIMKVRMVVSPWLIGPAGPSDVTAHLLPLSRKLGRTPVI